MVIGLFALALCSCSAPGPQTSPDAPVQGHLLWPRLPDQPRFAFAGQIQSVADVQPDSEHDRIERALASGEPRNNPALKKPSGIAARDGRIYVADPGARAVVVFDMNRRKVFKIGVRVPHELKRPSAVALDKSNRVYVLDPGLGQVMVFDELGLFLYSIKLSLGFSHPVGIAVSPDGQTIYVVDRGDLANSEHKVVAFKPNGKERFRLGPRGAEDGRFNIPLAAVTGADGALYVVDAGNFRVQVFDREGTFRFAFGGVGAELGRFSRPRSIALDQEGNIYVADAAFNNVQIFDPKGALLMPLGGPGRAAAPGNFALLAGIAVDNANNLYVVDNFFRKIEIFRRLSEREGMQLMGSHAK